MSREEPNAGAPQDQRYEYKIVGYGQLDLSEVHYGSLREALDEMAADGWRLVSTIDYNMRGDAVFERPVDGEAVYP